METLITCAAVLFILAIYLIIDSFYSHKSVVLEDEKVDVKILNDSTGIFQGSNFEGQEINYFEKFLENRKQLKLSSYQIHPNQNNYNTRSSRINCDYQSCVNGKWVNCIENMTNYMSLKYDIYRPRKSLPVLEKMLTNTGKCGFLKDGKTPTWCETGCCLTNHCLSTKACENRTDLEWNAVPENKNNEFRLDLAKYRQGEACDWRPIFSKDFEIFDRRYVTQILANKKLFIIGDSHARNMFVTLVSWIKNDYFFNQDFHPEGRYHKLCPGYYDLMYNINCVKIMEQRQPRVISDVDYFVYNDTISNFSIKYTKAHSMVAEKNFDLVNQEIIGPDCYYILSQGLHENYLAKPVIDRLKKFDKSAIGTFITPPWLSFAHGLRYKPFQNQKRLNNLINEVSAYLEPIKNQQLLNFNEITRNLLSMDGVHYSFKVNKVLLTIYLNGLI